MKRLKGLKHNLVGDAETSFDFKGIRVIIRGFVEVGPPAYAMPRLPGG
jgi:hypothetical protein